MSDYSQYEQMRDNSATPIEVYRVASGNTASEIERLTILKKVFGLTITQATEISIRATDRTETLDEHQKKLAQQLEAAISTLESEEPSERMK